MATRSPVEFQEFLDQATFPMAKEDLLREARAANVAPDKVASLEELPEQTYITPVDVSLAVAETDTGAGAATTPARRPRIKAKTDETQTEPSKTKGGSSASGTKPLQPVMGSPSKSEAMVATNRVASRLTGLARDRAQTGKSQLTAGLAGAAQALRDTTTDLREQNPMLADATTAAADGLERASAYIEERDVDTIVEDVQATVRRQPILVLGGVFALGLLATRLLKAGVGGSSTADQPKNQNER